MANTLTWTLLGIDKSSPAFQKVAKNADAAADRLEALGKDGAKSLGEIKPAAAVAAAATEDMADDMSAAVEKAAERMRKARQSEADQLGRLRVAQTRLLEVTQNTSAKASQLATAEEAVAAASRKVATAQETVISAQKRLNAERAKAIADADAGSDAPAGVNIDIKGGLDRIKATAIAELKAAGIVGGAAFAGGIAAGLSSIGAAGLFIGIAAAAQSSNLKVAEAYSDMWGHIKNQARLASDVLADDFIKGAERLGQTFNALKPQLVEGFTAAQPVVNDLFDGIDRGARQVMPGFVTAAKAASLASDNLADVMESAGRGVSNFLTEASQGAEAGGEALTSLGRIIERMGSFAGRIFADLANSSSTVFPALESTVSAAADVIENLSDTALPGLAAGASLAFGGVTLLLQLVNQIVTVLGPAAPAVLNLAAALKAIDLISFGQVGASWDRFKNSIGEAEGFAGKAKAGFAGFISSGLGPLGVVAGLAAFGLDKLAQSQQRAAQRQQAITAAFRESKGAIDENVRATVAKSLADEGLLDKGKAIGVSAGIMTDAWLGNKAAMDEVRASAARYTKELEGTGQMEGQVAQGADALSTKAHEVVTAMGDQSTETAEAARQGRLYGEAMEKGAAGAQGLAKANKEAAEALKQLHDQMVEMINKDLAYRNSVAATQEAQGALTEAQKLAADALKNHGAKSKEFAEASREADSASRSLEGAFMSQAQAAYDMAYANSIATNDVDRGKEASLAYTQEVLRMALAAGSNAPRALQMMAEKLSAADLQAIGATRDVNELRQTVIRLPDGKTITLNAQDNASNTIRQIANGRYTAVIKLYGEWAGYSRTPSGVTLSNSSARGNAEGGWIHGPGTGTSDSIPRMLSNGEFVVKASQAQKYGDVLEAINSGSVAAARAAMFGMPNGGGSGTTKIQNNLRLFINRRELLAEMREEIRTSAGGDVQRALGSR